MPLYGMIFMVENPIQLIPYPITSQFKLYSMELPSSKYITTCMWWMSAYWISTLVWTRDGLCVLISWTKSKTLKFSGIIWIQNSKRREQLKTTKWINWGTLQTSHMGSCHKYTQIQAEIFQNQRECHLCSPQIHSCLSEQCIKYKMYYRYNMFVNEP